MNKKLKKETYEELVEAICFIEITAQNMQAEDNIISNEWDIIEADARELREEIEELDYEEDYKDPQEMEATKK